MQERKKCGQCRENGHKSHGYSRNRCCDQHCDPESPDPRELALIDERLRDEFAGEAAKAALESDTRVLSYEAGRKWGVRVNTISAGPLGSRAAKAIGFIGDMINYSLENAPLKEKELAAQEVGNVAAFLCSPLSSAVTGVTLHVDNGLSQMGLATDSKTLDNFDA